MTGIALDCDTNKTNSLLSEILMQCRV